MKTTLHRLDGLHSRNNMRTPTVTFSTPPEWPDALTNMAHDARKSRSEFIVDHLATAVEKHLELHRKQCRAGKRLPKGKSK